MEEHVLPEEVRQQALYLTILFEKPCVVVPWGHYHTFPEYCGEVPMLEAAKYSVTGTVPAFR